jgi:hypothetical protein
MLIGRADTNLKMDHIKNEPTKKYPHFFPSKKQKSPQIIQKGPQVFSFLSIKPQSWAKTRFAKIEKLDYFQNKN